MQPAKEGPQESFAHISVRGLSLGRRAVIWAMAGSGGLLSLYFLILTAANSLGHAVEELRSLWYWIFPLVVGFGLQSGLFAHMRLTAKMRRNRAAASSMAVSGSVSTASMAACCAHHVTDVAPLLGASAAAMFLTRFQTSFMVLGIFSNLVGTLIMLNAMKKHEIFSADGAVAAVLSRVNLAKAAYLAGFIGAAVSGFSAYLTY